MGITYRSHNNFPENIYVRDFMGRVDVTEIIESWDFLIKNNLLDENLKGIINNITNCELDMNMESFHLLISFLKEHKQFQKIKLAVICNDPRIIVFPALGEAQEKSLKIKPFTTEAAAVGWIME